MQTCQWFTLWAERLFYAWIIQWLKQTFLWNGQRSQCPPPPKKLWKTFRMIELLLKSTLKTSLSLEVKYKEICGGSTKTSSCFTSCLWNHKLVWVYVKVFGEKSHNTWEFISKTDSSLDKIDRKYILKKKYFTLFAVYVKYIQSSKYTEYTKRLLNKRTPKYIK